MLFSILRRSFKRLSVSTYRTPNKLSFVYNKMASVAKQGPGLYLNDILKSLEEFAPSALAESWDNVGLLVDPMIQKRITTLLLTNDLTENVLDEAVQLQAGLIVSYHPPIFQGLKRVTSSTWKERQVIKCIKNEIAIYSPHTSWDSVCGGVNDWLANALPIKESRPLKPNADDPKTGAGRICELQHPISVKDACDKIKLHIGIPHLRLALARDKDENDCITTVALCAGSGSSVLSGVKADLYLTGEMLHHDVLDAAQKGIHVVLCNHSDSERGFLRTFRNQLQQSILNDAVRVVVSAVDADPLKTV